ncbi:hypothetical protein [Streptomyces sp. NPDC048659]|uniref:hypothetical protein n=1 Tax=Streptomyces sp. NPDC048659 TaxID=3155489 RepID=UPI00342DB1E6
MTDTATLSPAVILDALPAPCCTEGQAVIARWVQALADDPFSRDALILGNPYSAHMIRAHRITGRPNLRCVNCLEWIAGLKLEDSQDPDLDTQLGR